MANPRQGKPTPQVVHAEPQKEFFISMITRDISLEECIMDLLDNSVDGVTRTRKPADDPDYAGHSIAIAFDARKFSITDNCGGISIKDAVEYAFHFGKRVDAPNLKHGIGMYGIGMKRAMFKIGKDIAIESSTNTESFVVNIDVEAWSQIIPWEFQLVPGQPKPTAGTDITIVNFNDGISAEFKDATFSTSLIRSIGRVYARFIEGGLEIKVNEHVVQPFDFRLRESTHFKPLHMQSTANGIRTTIVAGLAGSPPDDTSAEFRVPEAERYGWYIVCNGRVIISGDKTRKTVWGDEGVPSWHSQYNGFIGIVEFDSNDPEKLPWTTTKADIEVNSAVYRKALVHMRRATKQYTDYTTARKTDLKGAKAKEESAKPKPIRELPIRAAMSLPKFTAKGSSEMATISYQKETALVEKVAVALGHRDMSYKTIGSRTFDYYVENEIAK